MVGYGTIMPGNAQSNQFGASDSTRLNQPLGPIHHKVSNETFGQCQNVEREVVVIVGPRLIWWHLWTIADLADSNQTSLWNDHDVVSTISAGLVCDDRSRPALHHVIERKL